MIMSAMMGFRVGKTWVSTALGAAILLAAAAGAQEESPSALTCRDFRPTPEALERFPDLVGACEGVVERNGELYGKFRAVVRRAGSREVTLYLPATDHTFVVEPKSGARVLVENRKVRPSDLTRGQEIEIYLAASEFARPDIEEVALVTDTDSMVEHSVATTDLMEHSVAAAPALPSTASPWAAVGVAGLALLACGCLLQRRRWGSSEDRRHG